MSDSISIFIPAVIAFVVGIFLEPTLSAYLYKNEFWKKKSVSKSFDGHATPISGKLHDDEARKTPRMGGVLVWGTTLLVALLLLILSSFSNSEALSKLSFLSRNQTWLPIFTLVVMSLVGLFDDYLVCRDQGSYAGGGMSLRTRLLLVALMGTIGAWWFYTKLDVSAIHIPFNGDLTLGILFVPVFILSMLVLYSGGIIDGVDGLAGGIFAIMFASYALIAYFHNQIDLAAFSMTVSGGLLAFLWFNIPPARFFLSETGTMGLTTTLVVIAYLTKSVVVLPIIALPLIVTTLSSLIQIASKRFRNGKKIFLVAPLHNYFQAIGWPAYKVTMRYWIIALVCAIIGVVIELLGS